MNATGGQNDEDGGGELKDSDPKPPYMPKHTDFSTILFNYHIVITRNFSCKSRNKRRYLDKIET